MVVSRRRAFGQALPASSTSRLRPVARVSATPAQHPVRSRSQLSRADSSCPALAEPRHCTRPSLPQRTLPRVGRWLEAGQSRPRWRLHRTQSVPSPRSACGPRAAARTASAVQSLDRCVSTPVLQRPALSSTAATFLADATTGRLSRWWSTLQSSSTRVVGPRLRSVFPRERRRQPDVSPSGPVLRRSGRRARRHGVVVVSGSCAEVHSAALRRRPHTGRVGRGRGCRPPSSTTSSS